ncbi:MAG: HAD hydrolase-like protein [Deltaproteobacteria bacterium]|jgi:phosphoglycolate phosphatase-like HAD superfamily hydrolase|nr:HAD hydrolase-like protein [Deltaproteobacteria bacterium]
MRPTILLFDIDRTLVDNGGAGRRAMERGLDAVHPGAVAAGWLDFELGGRTDPLIVAGALRRGGKDGPVEPVIATYLSFLAEELERARDRYVVYPGVRRRLEALSGQERVALGLGTGNVERGARLKLAPGDLWRFFAFGGFGDDATERADVLRTGAQRGAGRLGLPVERCRTVVIGDTPRDIIAGRAIGATCIGVATGDHRCDALSEAGAHHVFEDLDRPGVMAALLGQPA